MFKQATLVLSVIALTGCAGGAYDRWAESTNKKISDGYTTLVMGGKIQTELDKSVPSGFKINLAYRMGEGVGLPAGGTSRFVNKLNGDVMYDKSCKALNFNVALYNHQDALIKTVPILLSDFTANEKTIIDKDVFTDGSMKASSAVSRMVIKGVKCDIM